MCGDGSVRACGALEPGGDALLVVHCSLSPAMRPSISSPLPRVRGQRRRRRSYLILEGGLGNQLFQFAAAAAISSIDDVRVILTRPKRQLSLDSFLPDVIQESSAADEWRLGSRFEGATGWRATVHQALSPLRRRVVEQTIRQSIATAEELGRAYQPRPAHPARPLVLDGYFQHPDWYATTMPQIVAKIIASAPAGPTGGPTLVNEAVVVSVRGGDYVQLGWSLSLEYFEHALAEMGEPSTLRIITDDPVEGARVAELCTTLGWACTMGEEGEAAIDHFWMLAAAPKLVMSNSTFCWWATMVGDMRWGVDSPDRVVTFPEQWVKGWGGQLRQPTWRGIK